MQRRRALLAARLGWAGALGVVAVRLTGDSEAERRLVKPGAALLATRHLLEAGVIARRPGARPPRGAVATDLLHAASMLLTAASSPRLRRDALISAGIDGTLGVLSAAAR